MRYILPFVVLILFSATASSDDTAIAAQLCLQHVSPLARGSDGAEPGDLPTDYEPGFEACALLVRIERKKISDQLTKERQDRWSQQITIINQALRAAGLPLLSTAD